MTVKGIYRPISLMNTDQQTISKSNPTVCKKIYIHHDQAGLIPSWNTKLIQNFKINYVIHTSTG